MRLAYTREPGTTHCPDAQELGDAISARVRGSVFDPSAAASLVVVAQGGGGRHQGIAELRDAAGTPVWKVSIGPLPQDCAAVMDALALSIAIKLGSPRSAPAAPVAGHRWFGVESERLPAPPPGSAQPQGTPDRPSTASRGASSLRGRLGVIGSLDLAGTPGPALGLALDGGLRWPSFSLSLEARVNPPASGTVATGNEVHLSRYTGALVPCGHWLGYLIACGLVQLGAVRGTSNAMHPEAGTAFYAAAGARLGVEIPLGAHLALRFVLDGLGVMARPGLRIGGEPQWTAPPACASLGGGLLASF